MALFKQFIAISLFVSTTSACVNECDKFPQGFMFGASSAAYQIEGATKEGGRGVSIWDTFVHQDPSVIADKSTADIATDSYHRYKEDVQLLKKIGFCYYRFSISWVRILPRGEINEINQEGIDYYNRLIDELISNGITPVVTIYHWDLPQALQDLGGWLNPVIADYFEDYAFILFQKFGDRVKWWITINEPIMINMGYWTKAFAPGLPINGSGEYLVAYNLLRAHAKAYRLYEREFKDSQKGKVGITIVGEYFYPLTESEEDRLALERAFQFTIGWYAHPIFSKEGDYPPIMKEIINKNSMLENRRRSRLPAFTAEEINDLRGSYDFFGLNHYTTNLVSANTDLVGNEISYLKDSMFKRQPDPSWNASKEMPSNYVVPSGIRGVLNYIKDNYGNPQVLITENGYGDDGRRKDHNRIYYINGYLSNILKAIHEDECNVIGYITWSLTDNFEWSFGYTVKFGLVQVDFGSPERERKYKLSAYFMKMLIKTGRMPHINETKLFEKQVEN